MNWQEACKKQCADLAELLIKKQMDYGKQNILDFGEYGVLVRLNDKFARLKNLRLGKSGEATMIANEPITDTYRDIAGYSILAIMLRDGEFDLPFRGEEMTEATNDNWIKEQGWEIKALPITEKTHEELLNESIERYAFIWKELAKK